MAYSKAKASIKTLDDGYILVVDGEESEEVAYGQPVEMTLTDGRRFFALVEADGKDIESLTEFWAYEVLPVEDVPIIESDEDEDDEDEDDDDQDQNDDDDEDDDNEPAEADRGKVTV